MKKYQESIALASLSSDKTTCTGVIQLFEASRYAGILEGGETPLQRAIAAARKAKTAWSKTYDDLHLISISATHCDPVICKVGLEFTVVS